MLIRESDQVTGVSYEEFKPFIGKRGECYRPSGAIVHDFDARKAVSTFEHKGTWFGVYRLGMSKTCISESDMHRINPQFERKTKAEPSFTLTLHTPDGDKSAEFCAVVTPLGNMLAHKQTGTLYRLSGECMGSIYMWIKPTNS